MAFCFDRIHPHILCEVSMPVQKILARSETNDPLTIARAVFKGQCPGELDALFLEASQKTVFAVAGLPRRVPVALAFYRLPLFQQWYRGLGNFSKSVLLVWNPGETRITGWVAKDTPVPLSLSQELQEKFLSLLNQSLSWGGLLNADGSHQGDPRDPVPGPHFAVNLLIGNRIGFSNPLQTTPKSVVDRWGRGSFRSHAATQVLATRWDLRQEENGFPANRQFYLTENGEQVFYSAPAKDDFTGDIQYIHGTNWTKITYQTDDLAVERCIFLLPYEPDLPLACEVQMIRITNKKANPKKLRLVYTGMFGPSKPGALMEDVLYSNIIMQAGLLRNPDGTIQALFGDYQPINDRNDIRFQSLKVLDGEEPAWPDGFSTVYNDFVGNGTLEHPEGIDALDNRLGRKGPGFFALGVPVSLGAGLTRTVVSFTGLVSSKQGTPLTEESLQNEISALWNRYADTPTLERALAQQDTWFQDYARSVQFQTDRPALNTLLNKNLPFQVYYQTFVSRSFCQTQKGYREIGFREIQDLFASMVYFCAQGKSNLVRDLLGEWASHIHHFGYADHNFYWVGKEPGKWSDDALWLVQAVSRYLDLTGDQNFLKCSFPVAGSDQSRPLFETLIAIVHYSGKVSVGCHGIPLLDNADWNDCLKLDADHLDGPAKEKLYWSQVSSGETVPGGALQSRFTESVMNGFLLKLAADLLAAMAQGLGDLKTAEWSSSVSRNMAENLQKHGWKGESFARLLLNRHPGRSYVGADGDGLATDGTNGSHFLNSFSWAVLSDSASDEQLEQMYQVLETRMKTPFGYRLVSPMDLRLVEPQVASGEYFPGDRENGAVFKHASMMATAALIQGACQTNDRQLAQKMAQSAWWMIDLVAPHRTMEDPFFIAGNPRFCTQYNNSETGENIGPLLSGTASWLTLVMHRIYGIQIRNQKLILDPLLREQDTQVEWSLVMWDKRITVRIKKPVGFFRMKDQRPQIWQNGQPVPESLFPIKDLPTETLIEIIWEE